MSLELFRVLSSFLIYIIKIRDRHIFVSRHPANGLCQFGKAIVATSHRPLAPPCFHIGYISNTGVSRIVQPSRLKRKSKSVTDLRHIADKPLIDLATLRLPQTAKKVQSCKKPENKPSVANKSTPPKKEKGPNFGPNKPNIGNNHKVGKAVVSGVKRPLTGTKSNGDGQPKPKVAKKIPDWDYKGRFNQLNEKYTSAQESIKEMKLKISDFDEIETNYTKIQEEAKELAETKALLTEQCEELCVKNKVLIDGNEKLESELALLEKKHRFLEGDFKVSEESNKKLLSENEINSKEVARLSSSLNTLTELYEKLSKEHSDLTKKHYELTEQYKFFTEQNKDLLESQNQNQKEIEELKGTVAVQKTDLQQFQAERRRLHNVIQDLKGNIRVFCRVRPPVNAEEHDRLQCCINFIDENGLEIRKSRESVSQITGKIQEFKSEFMFDKVFSPESTQEEIFEDLAQLVQSALDGYDVCVFAYGQTGSGKTYTMQGGESPECKGMVPRTIDLIFQNIAELERSGWKYRVQASFLEIYNENVRDLLNINSSQKLDIYFNDGKGTTVTNLTIQPIESVDELKEYMRLAHRNRATAATDFNEHSSRSHAVTKIYLEGTMKDQNLMYKGSINLVDLAGSESAKQSVNGDRLTETKNINKSLATLGDVISALHCKSKHIPYRNSKLTYLLQSCLGGNSKTLMVVNISPFEECFGESISSLRFAAKVKEVKTASKKNKMALIPTMVKQNSSLTSGL